MKEGLGDLPTRAASFVKGVPREVLDPLLDGLNKLPEGASVEQVGNLVSCAGCLETGLFPDTPDNSAVLKHWKNNDLGRRGCRVRNF